MKALNAIFVGFAAIFSLFGGSDGYAAVGRTSGQLDVGSSGEARYAIPLFTPPGANGLAPTLQLEYNSALKYSNLDLTLLTKPGGYPQKVDPIGVGWMGLGWNITGLSAISRCQRTPSQDGAVNGFNSIKYTDGSDGLCMNGSRLRLVSGTHGVSGSVYQTEIESYQRITITSSDSYGPSAFEVYSADGRIYEYGSSADSQIRFLSQNSSGIPNGVSPYKYEWALTKIRDRSGNTVKYTYTQDSQNGAYYLSNVEWTSNSSQGTSAQYLASFVYDTSSRLDHLLHFFPETFPNTVYSRVDQKWRLARIDVSYIPTASIVKRYHLNYEANTSSMKLSRLSSIQECGVGGSDCLSPTIFAWTDGGAPNSAEISTGQTVTSSYVLDINGDGIDDFAYVAGGTWRYMLATSAGLGSPVNTGFSGPTSAMPMDWDGDGRIDLIGSVSGTWHVMKSNGAGFNAWSSTGTTVSSANAFAVADLNGDGRDDLVRASGTSLYARLNTGGNLSAETAVLSIVDPVIKIRAGSRRKPIDFNGDGREDLLVIRDYITTGPGSAIHTDVPFEVLSTSTQTTASISTNIHKWNGCDFLTFGDFNGDAKTDLAMRCIGLLRISSFITGSVPSISTSDVFVAADVDGNSADDLLRKGTTNYSAAYSTGNSLSVFQSTTIPSNTIGVRADVDGDSLDDFVRVDSGGVLKYYPFTAVGQSRFRNLLSTITDGFGVTAFITYAGLYDTSVHTPVPSPAWPLAAIAQSAISVVSNVVASDGTGAGTFTRTFKYTGGLEDKTGRGFAGFSKRTVYDSRTSALRSETNYSQIFPYIGLATSDKLIEVGTGNLVSELSTSWSKIDYGSGYQARAYPYVQTSTKRQYELGGPYSGTLISTINETVNGAPDFTSGVPFDVTRTTIEGQTGINGGQSKSERIQISSLLNDTSSWCIGKPQSTTTVKSHTLANGALITSMQSAAWDSTYCRMTSQTAEPNDGAWNTVTAIGYDGFGNVNSESVTGAGMAPRTTTKYWGGQGLAIESSTNPLAQTSTASWRYDLARQATATDENGLTTAWQYDGYGRPIQETRADGTSTLFTYFSCSSGCDSRVRYYVNIQPRDTAGAVLLTDQAYFDQFERKIYKYEARANGSIAVDSIVYFDAHGREQKRYRPYWSGQSNNGYSQNVYDAVGRVSATQLYTSSGSLDRQTSYAYDGLSSTTTDPKSNRTKSVRTAWGDVVQVVDIDLSNSTTSYSHNAEGQLVSIVDAAGNTVSSMSYNVRGFKTNQSDMDLGAWTFEFNPVGELTKIRDAKATSPNWTAQLSYDKLGRLIQRAELEGTSTWTWGASSAAKNIGKLSSVSGPGYSESYTYDAYGRPSTKSINSDIVYEYGYSYNSIGELDILTFPKSTNDYRLAIKYGYSNGFRTQISDHQAGTIYWKLTNVDANGAYSNEDLGNGVKTLSTYDQLTGELIGRTAGVGGSTTHQHVTYQWDDNGNLHHRNDYANNVMETYQYDALDRLTNVFGPSPLIVQYDAIGNIISKSDIGSYTYHVSKRHAAVSAGSVSYTYDANGNVSSRNGSSIAWTSYNKPSQITQNGRSSTFSYTPGRDRWKQVAGYSGSSEITYYIGGLLQKIVVQGGAGYKHYIPGGNNSVIVTRWSTGANVTQYLTEDSQGSVSTISDAAGALLVRESFSPFGARRGSNGTGAPSLSDWSVINSATRSGYTSHEHLDNLNLIHMNGRAQDPVTGRFLSADPYIQSPFKSQSLNRYSYVWNNPLTNTDQSGYETEVCAAEECSGAADNSDAVRILVLGSRPAAAMSVGVPRITISAFVPRMGLSWAAAYSTDMYAYQAWATYQPIYTPQSIDYGIPDWLRVAGLTAIAMTPGVEFLTSYATSNSSDEASIPDDGGSKAGTASGATPPDDDENQKSKETKRPNDSLKKGDKIDLNRFNERVKVNGQTRYKDPKSGYQISKDVSGDRSHGGSAWKLLDRAGQRVGTLNSDGVFLRR